QHDLAGPEPLNLPAPLDRLQAGRCPSAIDVNLPKLPAAAYHTSRIDVHYCRTTAELPDDLRDQISRLYGRRDHAHLLVPGLDDLGRVVQGAAAAADSERHEHLFGDAANHVEQDGPALMTGGNVEEDQLVGPFGLVAPGHLDRVA